MLTLLGAGRGVPTEAGGAFAPDSDATAIHWWDASVTASITGSGASLSMADQIGSLAFGTSTNNDPTNGATVNSLNALSFDGTERMWTPGSATIGDTFHLFMVADIGTPNNSSDSLVVVGAPISSSDIVELRSNNSTAFNGRLNLNAVGATSFNLSSGPYSGLYLVEIVANASTGAIEVFFDGVSQGSATGYTGFTSGTPAVTIFADGVGGNELPGTFCELVLCNAPRTGGDLTAMRGYLNTKWGL